MTILDEIFAYKKLEVATTRAVKPLGFVRSEAESALIPVDFITALKEHQYPASGSQSSSIDFRPALIAEVKKASPSRGLLCPDFDPLRLAHTYVLNGAAAISVLTDEKYFQGSLDNLRQIHVAFPKTPLLRKDFILDPYQVYEARAAGASAVLLIAAYLELTLMADLHALILELGMTPLVEVHSLDELRIVKGLNGVKLLGVNNRDLRNFSVKIETCLNLRPLVPQEICFVAESGIHTLQDVIRLTEAGVDAMLIGEALVIVKDIGMKVREFTGAIVEP